MEQDLNNINELIGMKEFKKALEELQSLDIQQNDTEAHKLMGLCYLNINNYTSAREHLETVVKYENEDATCWYYLAICYDNLDDYSKAKFAYNRVIQLRDKYIDAYKNLGVIYLKTGEFEKALELAKKALEIAPEEYIFYYLAASSMLSLKKFEESLQYFEKALELNTVNLQLYCNYGTALLSCQQYDKALEMYKKAIELDSRNAVAYYNTASVYQILGKQDEAIENFKKAVEYENSELFLSSLALAQFKNGKFKDAIENYSKLIATYQDKQNYKYNLVCCYEQIGELQNAIELLEQLIALNPKSKIMLHKLANILTACGMYDNAKRTYEALIANGFVSDEIYYSYAMVCIKTNDLDISERILKKVIELNPGFAKARKDLGVIYLNKRLFDYAKDEFEKAYETAPDNAEIVFEYANYYQATHENKEAAPLYEKAIALNSKNPNYYVFAALNAQMLKDNKLAIKHIEAALKLIPSDPYILLNAGKIYYAAKKYDQAQFVLVKSWEINQNPEVENLIGLTYMAQKEYEKACIVFEKLEKDFPANTNILLNYAKCCEKLERFDQAKTAAQKALEIFDDMPEAKRLLNRIKKAEKII